jgi:hypothetical protein
MAQNAGERDRDDRCIRRLPDVIEDVVVMQPIVASRDIPNVCTGEPWFWWGGWGSNPRPADYEKYSPVQRAHCLHR